MERSTRRADLAAQMMHTFYSAMGMADAPAWDEVPDADQRGFLALAEKYGGGADVAAKFAGGLVTMDLLSYLRADHKRRVEAALFACAFTPTGELERIAGLDARARAAAVRNFDKSAAR